MVAAIFTPEDTTTEDTTSTKSVQTPSKGNGLCGIS